MITRARVAEVVSRIPTTVTLWSLIFIVEPRARLYWSTRDGPTMTSYALEFADGHLPSGSRGVDPTRIPQLSEGIPMLTFAGTS